MFPSVFVFRDKGFVTAHARSTEVAKKSPVTYIRILFRLTYVFKFSQRSRGADLLKPEQKQRKL